MILHSSQCHHIALIWHKNLIHQCTLITTAHSLIRLITLLICKHLVYLFEKEKLSTTQSEFEQIEAVWADVTTKSQNLVEQLKQDLADQDASNLANRSEALKLLKSQLRDVSLFRVLSGILALRSSQK